MFKRHATLRHRPRNYAEWWKTNDKGLEWYAEIHDARKTIHASFIKWLRDKESKGNKIDSILEIGCGRAVSYADLFKNIRYVGYEISEKEIDWCKKNRNHPKHDYIAGDYLESGIAEKFDLVFSHAVIDHIYDIDAFLCSMTGASKKWIYVSSYRGWFPDLRKHVCNWSETETCFYNDISPSETRYILEKLQCTDIEIFPLATGKEKIPYETIIIARRNT